MGHFEQIILSDETNDYEFEWQRIDAIEYGELKPTFYVSDLSMYEWIWEYIDFFNGEYEPGSLDEIAKKIEWALPYLADLADTIWKEQEAQAQLPRGYGKTEIIIALFVRWFLEIRKPLYIVGPSNSHIEAILDRIIGHLEYWKIRRDYGDLMGKTKREKGNMTLLYANTGPLRKINRRIDKHIFLTTFLAGKKGKHPAWMHFEDVLQEEAVSEDTADRIRNRLNSTYLKMLHKASKFTLTLTRYGINDLYEYLEDSREKMRIIKYRALSDDLNEWLENPNFTHAQLLAMREQDITSFETEMNNNPIPHTGVYFEREHWRSIDTLPPKLLGEAQYYITIDPARGMTKQADLTAVVLHAIYEGKDYIIDGEAGIFDQEYILEIVKVLLRRYKRLNYMIAEKIMAQNSWLMSKLEKMPYFLPFSQTSVNAKLARIDALKGFFKKGLIIVYKSVSFYHTFFTQYLQYNSRDSTPTRKDDILDSLSMGIQTFGHFLGDPTAADVYLPQNVA